VPFVSRSQPLVQVQLSVHSAETGPMATIVERPIAEDIEYRPPAQTQNSNMFAVSIPNLLSERPVNPNCKGDSRR